MVSVKAQELIELLDGSVSLEKGAVIIRDANRLRDQIHKYAEISALEQGEQQGWARYLTRLIANNLGIYPASIHDLYMARGKNLIPSSFTVPAMNLRVLAFDSARAVFKAMNSMEVGPVIFEIARSEMSYTDQRPAEYATSILAAAIAEGYQGPVFIQGDHFQVSAKRYAADPDAELEALRGLMRESIAAGFFNIDVDASTLVDLRQRTIESQQAVNSDLSAKFTSYIRSIQPDGVTISIGGEIGEVGGQNSTEEELRGYLDLYQKDLIGSSATGNGEMHAPGLSKISIQTGTSHGGVVLPDGTIADVSVDFDTLKRLSQVARNEYSLGGAVQHGASTLPESAFHKFVEAEACEVHLATNFMNMFYEYIPTSLRNEIYAFLDQNYAGERKPGMTDEQYYYKVRKNAIGPFKKQSWTLDSEIRDRIRNAWEDQFRKLFHLLGLEGTRKYIGQTISQVVVHPDLKYYLGDTVAAESVSDLAD